MKFYVKYFFVLFLGVFIFIPNVKAGIVSEFTDFSFYHFYFVDENGKIKNESFYNWGSEDKKENGIRIDKTGASTIKVTVDASSNDVYKKCNPVLMWIHKGDGLSDFLKYTDPEKWYEKKLEETFLLTVLPSDSLDYTFEVDVPMKLNLGLTGIINGGYYEVEFFGEGAIPEKLLFAYKIQSYSLEELENYINFDMSDSIEDYYNADSGFRSNVDGFTFRNSDYVGGGGNCAGFAAVSTAKYNGYKLKKEYSIGDNKYSITDSYTWYPSIYGASSVRDLKLNDRTLLNNNSPSFNKIDNGNFKAYPLVRFKSTDNNDKAFYDLLGYYLMQNNKTVLLRGNTKFGKISLNNLENRWSIIDYVASYLRQGKAIIVNIGKAGGGHTIVGYKIEKIDDDTYRLYCYDSNYPDDLSIRHIDGQPNNEDVNSDGSYKNFVYNKREVYIDFTKKTIVGYNSLTSQREFDIFEFDSSNTSFPANSSNGSITFSFNKGDSIGVFDYGSESNEIISYKAYPVVLNDSTVKIRTFAFYKSGEVEEITQTVSTNVVMDYSFLGWYKIKDSNLILTKNGYKFNENGLAYVECYVNYNNYTDSFGKIKVRIPVGK